MWTKQIEFYGLKPEFQPTIYVEFDRNLNADSNDVIHSSYLIKIAGEIAKKRNNQAQRNGAFHWRHALFRWLRDGTGGQFSPCFSPENRKITQMKKTCIIYENITRKTTIIYKCFNRIRANSIEAKINSQGRGREKGKWNRKPNACCVSSRHSKLQIVVLFSSENYQTNTIR